MTNIMRADLYRVFKGKGIYITLAAFLLLAVLRVFANGTIGIGTAIVDAEGNTYDNIGAWVTDEFTETESSSIIGGGVSANDETRIVCGAEALTMAMADAGTFLYFLLPLIAVIVSADFSSGGVKNMLSGGISRTKYFLSKLLLSCACGIILYLLNIFVSTLVATVANGFGREIDVDYLISVLKPLGLQVFLCAAATCVGLFITFTAKSTGALIGFYTAWLFVPIMIIFILIDIRESFSDLIYYDITVNIQATANMAMMTGKDITRLIIIGCVYIMASIFGGLALFKRAEIK